MWLSRLRLTDFRVFVSLDWSPSVGLNLITGDNGAGKTSLLEAVHLLAYGRSFRGRVGEGLIRRGREHLEVYAVWQVEGGRQHQAGLRHSGRGWEGRLDRAPLVGLSTLSARLAVLTFEPGWQRLLIGSAEPRRRFLDWLSFHVEPDFLPLWRRYGRALRQRNALLKQQASPAVLQPWERELGESGERLARLREASAAALLPALRDSIGRLLPELGPPSLRLVRGWRASEASLAEVLAGHRARDLKLGHTELGPHRGDWSLDFDGLEPATMLSRGQGKLLVLACLLAQAEALHAHKGEYPILCLDDLASEIDAAHFARVIDLLEATGIQCLITGTAVPPELADHPGRRPARFHVEHGRIRSL